MGTFVRLLSLILCFELIVGPMQPSLSLFGQVAFAQQSCPAGFTYDSTLNRCLTKDETTKVMNATKECNGDKQCYLDNAKRAFMENGSAPAAKKENGFVSTIANAGAIAGPLALALGGTASSTSTCTSASFWTMLAGSVSFIVGDTLANMQHKSRLKKIKEEWGKIVNPEQANGDKDKEREISMEAQSQAFEMLAKSEDSLVKAAKMKKTFYTIAALAFTASGIISGLEIISDSASFGTTAVGNICKTTPTGAGAAGAGAAGAGAAGAGAAGAGAAGAGAAGAGAAGGGTTIMSGGYTSLGPVAYTKPSIFEYYVSNDTPSFKEHLFISNMESSENLASLIINQKAMHLKHSSPSLEEFEFIQLSLNESELNDSEMFNLFKTFTVSALRNLNPFPSAHAQEGTNSNAAQAYKEVEAKGFNWGGLVMGAAAGAAVGMLGKDLITPVTRTIFAGVMAGMSFIMASHAGSQAEASQKRADLLRKMRDEFQTASGAINSCKSEDRNDPAKPNCYCYTAENARNQNRSNSQICTKLWAGVNTKPTNYNSTTASSKVCITNTRQSDPACKCKQTKTCMQIGLNTLKGLNAGSMSVLSSTVGPMNQVASGSVDAASIDSASLANLAAKAQAMQKKLDGTKALSKINKAKKTNDLNKRLNEAAAKYAPNAGASLAGSSSSMPSNPGEAARMLEKEIEDSPSITTSGSNDMIATPSNNEPKENLEFGLTQDDLAAQETQLAEVMNQDLDYGGNDTNPDAKANIFEMLSHRYQRSGMKRLFDETPAAQAPGVTPVPAQTATAPAQK